MKLKSNGGFINGSCCPDCGCRLVFQNGCAFCPVCGWGKCEMVMSEG